MIRIITLQNDMTYTYRQRGDVFGDSAGGHYSVRDRFLILSDDIPSYDSIARIYGMPIRPKKYLIGHKKLFEVDSSDKRIKKQFARSSKRKNYFLRKLD